MSAHQHNGDLTPVGAIMLDDPGIGAREYARRATNHALAEYHEIGQVAREVAGLRSDVKTLLADRTATRKWRTRIVNTLLGALAIMGGEGALHWLHWSH